MEIPALLLNAFPPDREALFHHLRTQMDNAMLEEIANADYGSQAEEMMKLLVEIRDTGVIPNPPVWQLLEVLHLTRWCDPEEPEKQPFEPGPQGRSGHQIRMFVCTILMMMTADESFTYEDDVYDSTLAQALKSSKVLGIETSLALAGLLTWSMGKLNSTSEDWLIVLGLLVLSVRLHKERFSEEQLGILAAAVLTEEHKFQQSYMADPGNSYPVFSLQEGFWKPLVEELAEEVKGISSEEVRTGLLLCATLIC